MMNLHEYIISVVYKKVSFSKKIGLIMSLDVHKLRSKFDDRFAKSLFTGITNISENCYANVAIQLLIHNGYINFAGKNADSLLSAIFKKIENVKTSAFIDFEKLAVLIENFDIHNFEKHPFVFIQHLLEYDKQTANDIKIIVKQEIQGQMKETDIYSVLAYAMHNYHTISDIIKDKFVTNETNTGILNPTKLPKLLLVQVHRLDNENNPIYNRIGINNFIQIKLGEKKYTYKLQSIIMRWGDTQMGGHYTIAINVAGTYFYYNDSNVCQLSKEFSNVTNLESHCSLLGYTLIEDNDVNLSKILDFDEISKISPFIKKIYEKTNCPNRIITLPSDITESRVDCSSLLEQNINYTGVNWNQTTPGMPSPDCFVDLSTKFTNLFGKIYVPKNGIPLQPVNKKNPDIEIQQYINYTNNVTKILRKHTFGDDVGAENLFNILQKFDISEDDMANELMNIGIQIFQKMENDINNKIDMNADLKNLEKFIDNLIYSSEKIRKIKDNLKTTITEEDDEYMNFFDYNYDWKERAEKLNVEIIPFNDKISSEKTEKMKETDIAYKFIETEYKNLSPVEILASYNEIAKKICPKLNVHMRINDGSDYYSINYIADLLSKIKKNNGKIPECKKRGGVTTKMTEEIKKCLICTVLDFPLWSGANRLQYLKSKNGPLFQKPKSEHISVSTINEFLCSNKFVFKSVAFSPKPRNSIGFRIARFVWAKTVMEKIMTNPDAIIVFVDESSIVAQSATKTGRGFVGVTPTVTKGLSNDRLSLLVAIIPGYGEICRFFDGNVNGESYYSFLKESTNIIKTHIGNGTQTVIYVQDNAHIHICKLFEEFNNKDACLLNTVPYSPELNFVVENYFGYTKAIIGSSNVHIEIKRHGLHQAILLEWSHANDESGTAEATFNSYCAWKQILEQCINCQYIGRGPYHTRSEPSINETRHYISARAIDIDLLKEIDTNLIKKSMVNTKEIVQSSPLDEMTEARKLRYNNKKNAKNYNTTRKAILRATPEELARLREGVGNV